jgi:hypothetical protein
VSETCRYSPSEGAALPWNLVTLNLKRRRPKLGRQFPAVARWSFAFCDPDQSIAGDNGTLGGFRDIAKGN